MPQRLWIIAIILLLSTTAVAQTSPCSGGSTNPLFTVIPGNPAGLKFEHLTTHTFTLGPQVAIVGNNITVKQFPTDIPPPPGPPGPPSLHCNSKTVSLGLLSPGTYNVTWGYFVPSGVPGGLPTAIATYTFSFSLGNVPALSGPALACLMLFLGVFGVVMLRR
jgi:hypothetical protein